MQYSDFIGALEFKRSFGNFLSKGLKFLSGNERQAFCFHSPAGDVTAGLEMAVPDCGFSNMNFGEVTAPEGHSGTPEDGEIRVFFIENHGVQ